MGRLQRKKPAIRPKKKTDSAGAESNLAVNVVSTENSATSVSPIVGKKRRGLAAQKPPKAPLAYPGRDAVDKSLQFLREVKVELRKVTWPSRKQAIGSTAVVIVLVLIISLFLGVVDIGLSSIARVLLQ